MYVEINEDKLNAALEWFAQYITTKQKGKAPDFYTGYMNSEEGYKRSLYENGHAALQLDAWKESMIGSGRILAYVLAGLNAKDQYGHNNILSFYARTKFEDQARTDLKKAEAILYELYQSEDEADAFEEACHFWGRWYALFPYMMFLKDRDRFLPLMSSDDNHKDRFRKLGLRTECLDYCNWENYMAFIDVHRRIQARMIEAMIAEENTDKITLLDAHSFVWTLWDAPEDLVFRDERAIGKIAGAAEYVARVHEQVDYKTKAEKQDEELANYLEDKGLQGEEREVTVKARVNQGVYRQRLLRRYGKCCLCGVSEPSLLVASHIKPWCDSNPEEKIDSDNGLLLCPNHDSLFDGGWISFDEKGQILIAEDLDATNQIFLNINGDMKIVMPEGMEKYMAYHREHIFKSK